jgi:hypothetical protein
LKCLDGGRRFTKRRQMTKLHASYCTQSGQAHDNPPFPPLPTNSPSRNATPIVAVLSSILVRLHDIDVSGTAIVRVCPDEVSVSVSVSVSDDVVVRRCGVSMHVVVSVGVVVRVNGSSVHVLCHNLLMVDGDVDRGGDWHRTVNRDGAVNNLRDGNIACDRDWDSTVNYAMNGVRHSHRYLPGYRVRPVHWSRDRDRAGDGVRTRYVNNAVDRHGDVLVDWDRDGERAIHHLGYGDGTINVNGDRDTVGNCVGTRDVDDLWDRHGLIDRRRHRDWAVNGVWTGNVTNLLDGVRAWDSNLDRVGAGNVNNTLHGVRAGHGDRDAHGDLHRVRASDLERLNNLVRHGLVDGNIDGVWAVHRGGNGHGPMYGVRAWAVDDAVDCLHDLVGDWHVDKPGRYLHNRVRPVHDEGLGDGTVNRHGDRERHANTLDLGDGDWHVTDEGGRDRHWTINRHLDGAINRVGARDVDDPLHGNWHGRRDRLCHWDWAIDKLSNRVRLRDVNVNRVLTCYLDVPVHDGNRHMTNSLGDLTRTVHVTVQMSGAREDVHVTVEVTVTGDEVHVAVVGNSLEVSHRR